LQAIFEIELEGGSDIMAYISCSRGKRKFETKLGQLPKCKKNSKIGITLKVYLKVYFWFFWGQG
jgi:hypothetical protein